VVEALPMPDDIRAWIADFFAARHVERAFFKRTRDRFDPARRGRGAPRPAGDDE
jgi:hypothetical protein